MCGKNRRYEMVLPIAIAEMMENLSQTLRVSKGEIVARAIRLLSKSLESDRIFLVKGDKTMIVKVR